MNFCQDRNKRTEKRWISSSDRLQKKLLTSYFKVDDKTVADFSRFASQYGKLISYVNEKNRPDGDWSTFFKNDPTIALFLLKSIKTEIFLERSSEYLLLFEKVKTQNAKIEVLQKLMILASTIFDEVEQTISNLNVFEEFHGSIIKYIHNRFSNFFSIIIYTNKRLSESYNWSNPIVRNFDIAFKNYWLSENKFIGYQGEDWVDSATRHIAKNLPKIIHQVEMLKQDADSFLNNHVLSSGNIKPHIALFIAFCELYQNAQGKLNVISDRHLQHYFNEVLQLKPSQGTIDAVFVYCNVTTGANAVQLNEATKFVFQAKNDLEAEDFILAKPVELHEGNIIKVLALNAAPELWKGSFMNQSNSDLVIYDIFSEENDEFNLGFEISSEFLILEEGERRLTFDFEIDRMEMMRLKETVSAHYFPFDLVKLNEIISEAWTISYTNILGFQNLDQNAIAIYFHGGEATEHMKLRFDILIRKHQLPFLPLEKDIARNESTLRFSLKKTAASTYQLFRNLSFSEVTLEISVIGIKDLILYNDYGPLAIGLPFEPFGSRPKIGSNFYIGHKNLFLKPLNELTINFEWNNLPLDKNGFKSHYRAYAQIEDNASFKAKLSFLKDKNWLPEENKQVIDLFRSIPSDSSSESNLVSAIRRFNDFDIHSLGLNQESKISGPLSEYSNASTDGFIKMELCYPITGFGHDQYLELVQKAAFKSSKNKNEPELVNEPYTPSIKWVSLEYKSKISINKQSNKITLRKFHPFASEIINTNDNWSLLPFIPSGGSFFICMSPLLNGKEISLLFKINRKGENGSVDLVNVHKISYLDKSKWIEFSPEKITDDSSNQFQATGILKLKLPDVNPSDNYIDAKNLWLRFDLPHHRIATCIENVHLNGVLLYREKQMTENSLIVPEFSIVSLKDPIVQIDKIEQPYRSFGGKKPELEVNFRLKVSERIRHKSRGISNQDIEQILLAEFEDIQSLKCMNHLDANLNFAPGHTTIVVVPKGNLENNEIERYFPRENLLAMLKYLNDRALSGMNISLVNPIYEKVRLKFNVKFRDGYNERLAIKKLQDKVISFLNPWSSEKILNQGGSIPISSILNEVELEESVDYVTNFSIFHLVNNQIINLNTAQQNDLVISAQSPISILIPDANHKILSFNEEISTDKPGINDMMIGNDFLVQTVSNNKGSGLGFDVLEKTFKLSSANEDISTEKHIFTMYLKE